MIVRVLLHDDGHSLEQMGLHVAVHEPVARIIGLEGNDNIASGWYDHSVLANRLALEPATKIWSSSVGPKA